MQAWSGGPTYFSARIVDGSSSWGNVSLAHDEVLVAPIHVDVHVHDPHLAVGPDDATPASFVGDPKDTSLLPLYAHHVAVHVCVWWWGR